MKKIIFASQDPSSGNIIATIIKKLKEIDYQILGSSESKLVYSNENIDYIDADSIENLDLFFNEFKPDLVITGASMGNTVERKAIIIAKKRKIPSISILDFWVNYVERYSNLNTGEKFAYLPDYIFIMDNLAYNDMVTLGFPKEKLIVTGNPYFDSFKKKNEKGNGWLYVSNPDAILKNGVVEYIFNPHALNDLIEFLKDDEILLIRPHPKDDVEKFEKLIEGKKNIIIDAQSQINKLVQSHKIVIGMYTTILLQAALSHKIVIHYMPNSLPDEDDFICKRLNLCYSVYNKEDFFKFLNLIKNEKLMAKEIKDILKDNATEIVIQEIKKIISTTNQIN